MIKAILKSFLFKKYRWVNLEFIDGSQLCGVATQDMQKELSDMWDKK